MWMIEMSLPCERMAKYILPIFRSYVARALVEEYSFTQIKAAEKLGTTQAAVSQYLHSKRGDKGNEKYEEAMPMIRSAAKGTAKQIATKNVDSDGVIINFCKLCTSLRERHIPFC